MAKWQTIKSKMEYLIVQSRINELIDAPRTDTVHNELSLLGYLVEEYEEEYHTIPDSSPLEVIKFIMEMKGIKQKDLIPILGSKSTVSKILNGSAKMQLEMIQPLSAFLGIPQSSLIPKLAMQENVESNLQRVAEEKVWYKKIGSRKS